MESEPGNMVTVMLFLLLLSGFLTTFMNKTLSEIICWICNLKSKYS